MARRRRRKLHVEELEGLLERPDPAAEAAQAEEEKTSPQGEQAADTPQARVLELQKSAGNRAVAAALERRAGPAAVAGWPKQRQLIIDGTAIPLESYSESSLPPASPVGQTKPRADEFTGPGEMIVYVPNGGWTAGLIRAARARQAYERIELVIPTKDGRGIRIILTAAALVSLASASDDLYRLTLQFMAREYTQSPPP